MYTQCPDCKKPYALTVDELRTSQGMLNCEACNTMYDALELLKDGDIPNTGKKANTRPAINSTTPINEETEDTPFLATSSNKQTAFWSVASAVLIMLLIIQVYYFEAYKLTQNAVLRPGIKKICAKIPRCQLPSYKNLDEISILNGSFEAVDNHYIFKTAFINQADFSQKRPSIKLTLLDFNGHSFASRLFHPQDYSKKPLSLLHPNIAEEITLTIATPSSQIGGYRFELI